MESRISIVTLAVDDIERAREFYTEGLGFKTDAVPGEEMIFLKTNGTILGLYPLARFAEELPGQSVLRGDFSGITLAHNVQEKHEVLSVLDQARSAGAKIVKEASDTFWGGFSGYFRDPDGYYWEVAWAPFFNYDERGNLKI